MDELERRFHRGELELRAEGEERRIIGYAAVFNQLSENLGGFREMIMPGAFTNTIKQDDIRGLYNHDTNLVLGRNTAGTLTLTEDDIGLRYEIIPPDTGYARDLVVSIDRKDVDQSSFMFRAIEESWRHPDDDNPLPTRLLHEVKLFDVSPVTFPAYPTTSVAVRDLARQFLGSAGQGTGEAGAQGAARRLALLRRKLQLIERL